eukprot:5058788-Heterocapsa_arctica.AAC.1
MDKLAETGKLLSCRQYLLFLYMEFKKDDHNTDAIAYGNLEKIVFKGDEGALEHFLTLRDSLHVQGAAERRPLVRDLPFAHQ